MSVPGARHKRRMTAEEFAAGRADEFGDIEIVNG
jgi:hypothetical protein